MMGATGIAEPVHSVTLKSYFVAKTEVTQGEWIALMGNNPSSFKSVGNKAPVEYVSWYDCISYCNKCSILENKSPCYSIKGNTNPTDWTTDTVVCDFTAKGYRLPTEEEWEYAARGGNKSYGYTYSGSNTVQDVAWFVTNSENTTHPVGTKKANELGVYDMSGNVFEWCWDWNHRYTGIAQRTVMPPRSGKILRGGGWDDSDNAVGVSYRSYCPPGGFPFAINGSRIVQTF